METLGDRLKKLKNDHQLTNRKLAGELGISHALISAYENNKSEPTAKMIIKYADFFDVSVEWILKGATAYSPLSENETKMLELYRALNNIDKIKIEGIMEEKLRELPKE